MTKKGMSAFFFHHSPTYLTYSPLSIVLFLPSFFSQILDLIHGIVLIFILIYFEWRDTENQQ